MQRIILSLIKSVLHSINPGNALNIHKLIKENFSDKYILDSLYKYIDVGMYTTIFNKIKSNTEVIPIDFNSVSKITNIL